MITLKKTVDVDHIKAFMTSDYVWEMVVCDILLREYYSVSLDDLWFDVLSDGEFVGIVRLTNFNSYTINLHPYILKSHRAKSRDVIYKVFEWFLTTPCFINKLNATIPFYRKIVYNLAKKTGFRDEGVNRSSILKNGKFYDQWNVGITKSEIKGLLWET